MMNVWWANVRTSMRIDMEQQWVVSAYITYNDVGTLTSIDGKMKAEIYFETLNNALKMLSRFLNLNLSSNLNIDDMTE